MAKRRKNYVPKDEGEIQEVRENLEETVESQENLDVHEEVARPSLKNDNRMKILAVAGILALLAGLFIIYKVAIKAPKEAEASTSIYKAEEQFARDSFALALENPGGGYDGFLDIIDKYNGTKAGNLAKYYAGISYLNLGRHKDAISYLEAYNAPDELTSITKAGALGDAYAEDGNEDKALSFYEKASKGNNDFLTPYYLKKVGLLNQKKGNNGAALAAFQKIKNEYGQSSQGTDIDRFIAQVQ